MKLDVAKKWVKALRSGKYKQGRGALCEDEKYCCLGVLCEVAIKDGVKLKKEDSEYSKGYISYSGYGSTLPPKVLKYADMKKDAPVGIIEDHLATDLEDELIYLNDTQKYSFKKIADFIEKNFIKTKKKTVKKQPSSK